MNRIRRTAIFLVLIISLLLSSCGPGQIFSPTPTTQPTPEYSQEIPAGFVTVSDGKFILNGKPYYFIGANFWQGMNLGVDGSNGDRDQLVAELDRLQQLGVTNLRVIAASEGPNTEPYRMVPALMTSPGVYDDAVLDGLDFFVAEMGKHGMYAVMVLNNYWQWSGGMAQYVSWSENNAPIPYPGNWNTFMEYSAKFYDCDVCQVWYRNHIEMIINHVNPYTGLAYRDDPTIFSWELANEPRSYPEPWIDETAAYIKSLDPYHMVTTGSEGSPPGTRQDFKQAHNGPDIDYATLHIWPQNWGWYDPENPASYGRAEKSAIDYFRRHVYDTEVLNKPLVLEEFGLARDFAPLGDIFNPDSPTLFRDRFYQALFEEVYAFGPQGGPVAGYNFWAWGGRSRPGDPWVGDPPHETPGWYSVYSSDASTLEIIAAHAANMNNVQK